MTLNLLEGRQCTARSKRSGERCKRAAIVGGTVCSMHGGKAPAVAAAAEQRELEKAADAEIAKIWPGLVSMAPVTDPVDLLARTAGALEQMADVVGARVNDLNGKVGAGTGLQQLRAEVVLLDRVLDKVLKASEALARLGIEERVVELEQGRAQLVISALQSALAVLELLPADRDLAVRTFLVSLGVSGDLVQGELVQGGAA